MGLIIDKEFIKNLKNSKHVVFRYNIRVNIIECIRETKDGEHEYTIPYIIPYIIRIPAILETGNEIKKAFEMIHLSQYDRKFQTIVSMLRAGDEIEIVWSQDYHTNEYIRKAGLHADTLELHVIRKSKRLEFEISTSICEQNTARMINPDRSCWE